MGLLSKATQRLNKLEDAAKKAVDAAVAAAKERDAARYTRASDKAFYPPVDEAKDVERQYKKQAGVHTGPGRMIDKVDIERAKRIADAYQAMPHEPMNPDVQRAYSALADETLAQYQALLDRGVNFDYYRGRGEPYKSSPEMADDLRQNRRLKVLATEGNYGQGPITEEDVLQNPMLRRTDYTDAEGNKLLVNDIFRAVHDYFGPDGQLRQEISDKGAALKIDPSQEWSGPFGDMYSNENLFAAYPDLARVLTEYNPNAYHSSFERSTYQKPPMIKVGGGAKDAAEGATHEAQHYIQNVEMFGGGASPLEFMPKYEAARDAADAQIRRINPLLSEKARQMEDIRQQIAQTPVMMRDDLNAKLAAVRDEYQALIDEKDKYIQATLRPASDLAMDEYRKYAGEQEAYATEARMGLDVPQMIERPRTMDMDVPMSEQKIRQQMPMPRTYRQLVGGAAAAGAASQAKAAQPDPVTQQLMQQQKPAMPDGVQAYVRKAKERRGAKIPEGVPTPTRQMVESPKDYTGKALAAGAEGLSELDRRLQGSPFSILSPTGFRDYMLKRAYNDEVGTLDKVGALFDIAALGRGKAIMQGRARPTTGELVAMPGLSALLGGEYTPENPDEQVLRDLEQYQGR